MARAARGECLGPDSLCLHRQPGEDATRASCPGTPLVCLDPAHRGRMTDWLRLGLLVTAVAAGTVAVGFLASSAGPQALGLPLVAVCALASLAINLLAFVPAAVARTEHFFDLTGTITYLAILGVVLGATWGAAGPRSWLVALLVGVWLRWRLLTGWCPPV